MDRIARVEIKDDKVYAFTPIYGHGNFYERQIIMTKEIFQECYKRWIKESNDDIGN